jgi:small-conductance mechanosensitive channel
LTCSDRASTRVRGASRPSSARALLAFSFATLLIALDASAQDTPPAQTPVKPAEIVAIPLAEISQRAEKTTLFLSKTAETLSRSASIAKIEEQLPEIQESMKKRRKLLSRALATGGNRSRLFFASAEWDQTRAQITRWKLTLTQKLEEIRISIELLSKEREIWELTRQDSVGTGAPEAITQRVQATLSRVDEASANARQIQASLLTLQDQIVQQDLLAAETLDRIAAVQRESHSSLFQRDAPPLWLDLFAIHPSEHFDDVRTSIGEDLRKLRDFAEASGSRFLVDLLILIAVIRYASAVKRRLANPVEGVPPIGSLGELFQRPIAIAVLATILAGRWVHDPFPLGFSTLIGIALLVPLVRLVPLLLPTQMRWVVWVLATLLMLSRMRLILHNAPLASELLFVLEALGMIATLFWLMRPSRLREVPADIRRPRLLGAGMHATLALVSTSLVASALGFREIGVLIGSATLWSVYAAVILFATARALEAAVEASFYTAPGRKLSFVRRRRDAVLRITGRCASALAMIYWGYLTLQFFEILESMKTLANTILDAGLAVGEIEISLRDVLAFAITIVLAFMLSRLLRFFLEEEAFPRMRLRRGVGNAVATLLQYAILLLGFALALSAAGMDFSRVALFAGAFSVGLGFGLQTVVNNFVSGLILLFERPIQIGDMVEIGGVLGEVRRIGARSSTVRTVEGAEVIVPNANLISDQVVNWTLSDRRRRLEVEVGVAYGTDPEVVLGLLRDVGGAHQTVLDAPSPEALFLGFGESALNFQLRVWIPRFEESYQIRSELGVAINSALRDAGISIPFPQRDLHVRSVESDVIRSLGDQERT